MKNVMHKTTLREIRGSLGRWLAIMAIVALGVGFFCGLKMCKDDFMKTGDDYVLRYNLYNYKLITSLGLEEEDVSIIADTEGVKTARGSWSSDVLFTMEGTDGSETVGNFHTLLDDINQLDLLAGNMPDAANTFVGDARYFTEEDLGKTITLASTNDEDTLDMFAFEEYRLVGLVNSPEYLNHERGTTSLGSGSVSCFGYLPDDGWDSDVYTEIYVDFAEDYTIFSDEYIANDEVMEDRLETALEECGQRRYDVVIEDARETLADAQKEVDEAAAELEDGKKELEEGRIELEDGKKELADGLKELQENRQKLEDAKIELIDGQKELEEGRIELEDGKKELEEGRIELEDARIELEEARAELEKGWKEWEKGWDKYTDGRHQLNKQRQEAYARLDQALAAGYLTQEQYDAQKASIQKQLAPAEEQLDDARRELKKGKQELEDGEKEFAEGEAEFAEAEAEIADAEREIADAEKEIADGEKEIADAEKEIADGEKKLKDGEKELADARRKIADAETEIADAEKEIADGEKKIADAREELRDAEKEIDDIEYPTTYVLGRDANMGYACFESDSSIVDGISRVFPIFFFLVAALVCMTTMTRMIDEQRTQIGVLKALGYNRSQIMSKYVFYSGSAAMLGSVAGFFIGIHLFPWVIWTVYGLMYGFADIIFQYNWLLGGASMAVALLCCVGTTVWSCGTELKEVPAQLIRPKAPQAGKRIWLEYIPFIWNRLSFLVKVSIRNTFRYRKRFIMMVIGISGCTALLVTGLGINDSVSNLAALQYDQIYHVDYTVSFQKDMKDADQQRFREEASAVMEDCIFLHTSSADAKANGFTKSVTMIATDDAQAMPAYIELFNDEGAVDWPEKGQAVINSNMAKNMGLSVGDTLSVFDGDMREMQLEISGLCDNYVNSYLYLSQETYENSWGPMETNAALVLGAAGEDGEIEDPYSDSTIMLDARNVSAVSLTEDMRGRIEGMIGTLSYIVLLVIACAGALAFIVLYNLTNINITERIREIATIKVLGFYAGETAQYVFRENILLTAIAAVVGLPLGKALHTFVLSQVKVDALSFHMYISPLSYILGIVITFVFAFMVSLVMQRKLAKVSMTESLKSIE